MERRIKENYTYDGLGRVTRQVVYPSVGVSLDNTYTYKDVGENNTTTQVSQVTNALGTYDYEYDANGNITKITFTHATDSSKSYVIKYQYDEKNQLISEDRSSSNYIYVYTYDDNGNMLSYSTYGRSESGGVGELKWSTDYEYTDSVWGDLLIDDGMDRFYYDEIGNPLDYAWNTTMTWKNGRQLETVDLFGDIFTSYEYNADGQRISKTVEDVTTEFFYAGDILAGQKTGDNILMWIYDNNGAYIGFTYNGVEYYYVYNLQGDVEAITDSTGTIVASYTYGAWGTLYSIRNHTTSGVNIAEINPIRYRGYYYDAETNFYYLNSRYYDPGICRFINADSQLNSDYTGYNMFAYCGNNPVNRSDSTGHSWFNDIKKSLSNAWNSTKKWVSNTWNKYVQPNLNKLWKTVVAAYNSLELEVSSGFGLSGEVKVAGIGAKAGMVTKMPQANISNKGASLDECVGELYLALSLGPLEIGPHYTENVYEGKSEFTWYRIDDTFTIVGLELYLIYGISAEINFNYQYFCEQVIEIYE